VLDHNLLTGTTVRRETAADKDGRLNLAVDGNGHELSFVGPGTGSDAPVLLPVANDVLRLEPGREIALPIRLYNPRGASMTGLKVRVSSDYPTVEVVTDEAAIPEIASGSVADVSGVLRLRVTGGAGYFAPASLKVAITYDDWHTASHEIPILIAPGQLTAPIAFEVLDGRTVTFNVFRQKGNQGGGSSVKRTVTEGRGNGNGILEPGEEATIWVQLRQGLDAFDKNNWYRTKVHDASGELVEVADLEEAKQLEWTGAKERTSLVRPPAKGASAGGTVLLENESWSYHFTPDVRYGKERLYQAFQVHTRHLHRLDLKALTTARPVHPR
jgi:hypothetical protein